MLCRAFNIAEGWDLIHDILYGCGDNSMRDLGCIQFMQHCAKEKFFCDIFDDVAFFAGVKTNHHVRLIAIAVLLEHQRKGYGSKILFYEMRKAIANGLRLITFKTKIGAAAEKFWRKMGAQITGRKDLEWEMKLQF